MDLVSSLLDWPTRLVGLLVYAAVLIQAAASADWRRLRDSELQHVYFGAMAVLAWLWFTRTGIKPGLNLHILGVGLMTLMFGRALAVVALSGVMLGLCLVHGGDWTVLGLDGLILIALPSALCAGLLQAAQWLLPPNFFVFVFVNGYLGSALALCLSALAASLLLASLDVYSWHYLSGEYLPFAALLSFGEGFLAGGLAAMMAVYRPHWIGSFDDRLYLAKRPEGHFDS